MARKIALLIGVGDFGTGLSPLRCPKNGVAALRTILNDPALGGFDEVVTLINPGVGEMRSRICEVFAQLTKQDLVLFYFTGHGIKDMTGNFYLTTAQSQLFQNGRPNAGTAVEAAFLRREISNAFASRKVIILDCCFGAAFADGFLSMNDNSIDLEAQLGGKGWCVLTSSTSAKYALEKEGEDLSVYTRYLVEGIKTGAAAPDGQDVISALSLHEYVQAQVKVAAPAMEPAIFNGAQGYDIVIAKAQVDNAQRYRKQVRKKIKDGEIGPAGMAVLAQWQHRLGLSTEQAKAIEAEILQPYKERQRHLALYTQALEAEKGYAYPLDEGAVQNLSELQRLLQLRSEDIQRVEQQVLGRHLRSAPHQIPSQTPSQIPSQCLIQISTPPAQTLALRPIAVQRKSLKFETVQIDPQGKTVSRIGCESVAFTESVADGVTLEMVCIPGGSFVMGAPAGEEGACEGEWPQQEVSVPEFWMGRTVITRSQWQVFLNRDRTSHHPNAILSAPRRPVENVFWTDAVEFCQWLSQRSGRTYQLPSSAQWEYACRAGTTTPFYFGDTLTPALANYNGNYAYGQGRRGVYRQQTTAVGSFPPNAFGLYDMHGNVWEWCVDGWHSLPTVENERDRIQQLSSKKKFLRGGSWSYLPTNCRSAYRLNYPFHNRIDDTGFRVVCLAPKL
ncbi:MAG: SUMF1/EgtB/PvdO family nonheme iron enzyme [Cyanobacteria bacterium J06597_16]